jgi:hypothetical protein
LLLDFDNQLGLSSIYSDYNHSRALDNREQCVFGLASGSSIMVLLYVLVLSILKKSITCFRDNWWNFFFEFFVKHQLIQLKTRNFFNWLFAQCNQEAVNIRWLNFVSQSPKWAEIFIWFSEKTTTRCIICKTIRRINLYRFIVCRHFRIFGT